MKTALPQWDTIHRVLFVRLSALGDVLDATPVAEAIKTSMPGVHLGWVVDRRCAPILQCNPFIDQIHIWDETAGGSWRLMRELRSARYDVVLDAQGLLKSTIVARVSGAPYRLGLDDAREGANRFYTRMIPTHAPYWRVAERALGMLEGIGIKAIPEQFELLLVTTEAEEGYVDQWLVDAGLQTKEFVVLGPATTTPERHWLAERWAELADRLRSFSGLKVILLAGKRDRELIEEVASLSATNPVVSAGDLNVRESACVVRRSAAVVALDSYLLHVGLAVKTPTVALFGPTPTTRFEREPGLTIVEKPYHCRPCGRHPTCDGDYTCMRLISVSDVLEAIPQTAEWGRLASSPTPATLVGSLLASPPRCEVVEIGPPPQLAVTRSAVDQVKYQLLQSGQRWQPDIYLTSVDGSRAVLKDYSRRGLVARWWGAILVRREEAAYGRLREVEGVPKAFGRHGRYGLLTEFIDAKLVTKFVEKGPLPSVYFDRLYAVVGAIHSAGVAHGDLKRRKNLMITDDHRPYIIDFASAWWKGRRWNLPRNWLYRQMCRIDGNAVAKLKARHGLDQLTPKEQAALDNPTGLERFVRRMFGR